MTSISFSLSDYQKGLASGRYEPPSVLCPYYQVDPVLYVRHGTTKLRRGKLRQAVDELRKRTGRTYFGKTFPLQSRTLDYSARSFPAYRFILPEVMTEDWLAIVDWGKFQRDHVLHQPLCGYIILKLLDGDGTCRPFLLPNGMTLLDACVERILRWRDTAYIREFLIKCGMDRNDPILDPHSPISRPIWRIVFKEVAYVAAIFHDLGYPWQYTQRLQSNLDGMNASALHQPRNASQIVGLFKHRLLFHALQGYRAPDAACPSIWHEKITDLAKRTMTETHGFPGALGFLHLNDCLRRYPDPMQSPLHLLCVEWAAVGIMMHDMVKIYWGESGSGADAPANPFLRLSFDRDPISALVTLTDVIQDFERPAVGYDTVGTPPDERVTLKYDKACSLTEVTLDTGGVLTLCYEMTTDEMRATKQKSLPRERHDYFDAHYGYLDMNSLGIRNVRMVAR
jgi:hypothetical protein